MNHCYLDFEGKIIIPLQFLSTHTAKHQMLDPKSNLVFWRNKWFNGEPIYSTNRFSILQYGDKYLLEQACDVLMISKIQEVRDHTSYIYDLLEDKEDWPLQIFLLLLNHDLNTDVFFSTRERILKTKNNRSELMLWNYIVDLFSLSTEFIIPHHNKTQIIVPKDCKMNDWITADIERIQLKPLCDRSIEDLLYFYTLFFFDRTYTPQHRYGKKEILQKLSRMIASEEKFNLQNELELIICQMGNKCLPLLPKELFTKSKIYILTNILSRIPIEVYEDFVKLLAEDKEIELDTIVELSTDLKDRSHHLQNRLSILKKKYPPPVQWKYISQMSIEPDLQSVYTTFCLSVVIKINSDHIILTENSRYQPHNFTLDREIHLFMKSKVRSYYKDQNQLTLSFQNRLIVYAKNYFRSILSSDQFEGISSHFHDIEWTLFVDKTWDEIKAYVSDIKIKCEHLEYISQKSKLFELHISKMTIDSDIQSIEETIAYLKEQDVLHQRIMTLHHELLTLGGNTPTPRPPYKKLRWLQLENNYKFQIGRRYHLQNLSKKAFLPLSIIPEGKLHEEDFTYWSRCLEQQVYWKDHFCTLEQYLTENDRKKLRQYWQNQYIDAREVSEILRRYQQIIKKRRYKVIFFFFSLIVICVLLRVIYII